MKQIDKKALYLFTGYETGCKVYKSYATPIIIVRDETIFTSNKKYSATTSKHKSYIINTLERLKTVVTVSHDDFKKMIYDEKIDGGRM